MGWVVSTMPWLLYPQEGPGTPFIGDWVGLGAGLDGYGKSHPPLGFDPQTIQPVTSVSIMLSRPRLWRFSKPLWQLLLMFARNAVHCGILKVYQLNTDLWFAGGVVAIGWLSSYVQDSVRLITNRLGTVTLLSSCESSVNLRNTDRSILLTKHQEFLHGVRW
jgi:hypothetical protein